MTFTGLIEINYISSSRNSSGPQNEEKGIFFLGVNGDFWYNRYHASSGGSLIGWENLKVDVDALKRLIALKADLNSPVFTGIPAAPTATENDSSRQIANTEFVMRAITALIDSSPATLNTLNKLARAIGSDPNFATTVTNALAGKQPLNALLTALSTLTTSADKLPYFTGVNKVALTVITSTARTLLQQSSIESMQTTLGLSATQFQRFRGQLPTDANLNTYGPVEASVGIWSKPVSTNADVAHNFPEANAAGYLEVLPAGQFGGMQRYTVRTGNIYVRGLTASWNGQDGPWDDWLKVGNNAATAAKLATARTIGGVSFDGSANIDLPGVNKAGTQNTSGNAASATKLQTARKIGGVAFDGTADIVLPGVNAAGNQNTTGNAATATKLQTAITIGGVSFDGSASINLPGVNAAGNQNTSGNAATATKLQTARTINGKPFDGTANITLAAKDLGLADSSGYVGRLLNMRVFTSSGTYTPTQGTKRIRVTITGGGGGGGGCQAHSNSETFFGAGGGAGGTIISVITVTAASYSVTIGSGGSGGSGATNGNGGGDSKFASLLTAPGGQGAGKTTVTNTGGGYGGVPTTGDIRIPGGDGSDGQAGTLVAGGCGGASYWGGGGRAGVGTAHNGLAPGSGGGGAYDNSYSGTAKPGGRGANGICIIEEFM